MKIRDWGGGRGEPCLFIKFAHFVCNDFLDLQVSFAPVKGDYSAGFKQLVSWIMCASCTCRCAIVRRS